MRKLRVGYVVNHYPKVSHSFIRREILAIEDTGIEVERLAVRGWDQTLVDEMDRRELGKTHYILRQGVGALAVSALREALTSPGRFVRALAATVGFSRRSDRSIAHHLAYLMEAADIAKIIRERGLDHLHAHFGTNSTDVAMLASILTGVPYSFTVHGADEVDRPVALNLPEKVQRAQFVVAVSCYGRGQLYRWCAVENWDKIHIVHCGVDDVFLAEPPVPKTYSRRLVCVGRLCNEKAQLLLVEAAGMLARQNVDFQLVLAGDGEKRQEIEAMIERLSLAGRVTITGWIDSGRVKEEILAARALVLPSLMEGIPVAIMESMALGRPVVTTFVGGIPELVRDGVDGWLVPAGSVADLAEALKACLEADDEMIRRLGESGRSRVLDAHSVVKEAAKLGRLFSEIPGPEGAAGAVLGPGDVRPLAPREA